MDTFDELRNLLQSLQGDGVPYALCGGLALTVHGIIRATEDIDLLIHLKPLRRSSQNEDDIRQLKELNDQT